TIWVAASVPTNKAVLCTIRGTDSNCDEAGRPLGEWVGTLYQARDGSVWTTGAIGVARWQPGTLARYASPQAISGGFEALSETESGMILVATAKGIRQVLDGKLQPFPVPMQLEQFRPDTLFRDRDGGLWIGTLAAGLVH